MFNSIKSHGFKPKSWALAALLGFATLSAQAGMDFPALNRDALQVKKPEKQFMLSALQLGGRWISVGERGVVALSDDAGKTWRQAAKVPVSVTLTALSFANQQEGWAVGHGGVILRTGDAGNTWLKQADGSALAKLMKQSADTRLASDPNDASALRLQKEASALLDDGPDKPLLDVFFTSPKHGWVVGAYNLAFETQDGGNTWVFIGDRLNNPKSFHLNAIRAIGRTVYIVGEQGMIHRSLDGGKTFEALQSPYRGSWFSVALSGEDKVLVGGLKGNAFRSNDGGQSWAAISGLPPISIVGTAALANGEIVLANQASQVFVSRSEGTTAPMQGVPLPMLAAVSVLGDKSLLGVGLGGVVHLPLAAKNKGAK